MLPARIFLRLSSRVFLVRIFLCVSAYFCQRARGGKGARGAMGGRRAEAGYLGKELMASHAGSLKLDFAHTKKKYAF